MSYARFDVVNADCLDALRNIPDCSVDAIVTDPPYGLSQHSSADIQKALTSWLAGDEYKHGKAGFMGKSWDSFVPSPSVWRECFRVLKHGGHILCFAGSRTQDLMSIALRLAGFECRDTIMWVYGSGFPKSLDVSNAIDKAAGAEREVVGKNPSFRKMQDEPSTYNVQHNEFITAPATEAARQWQGWGTALKPAYEPVLLFRKPLSGTVAENVLTHGTGALNIDGCRIELNGDYKCRANGRPSQTGLPDNYDPAKANQPDTAGRWPTNLIHDGSGKVVQLFGDAARFFYCAKASKKDRGEANIHPTVKPTDLMRYLCRLITPPDGVILDPFMGSGSTGKAAILEGFRFIGIEQSPEYFAIARARINSAISDTGSDKRGG